MIHRRVGMLQDQTSVDAQLAQPVRSILQHDSLDKVHPGNPVDGFEVHAAVQDEIVRDQYIGLVSARFTDSRPELLHVQLDAVDRVLHCHVFSYLKVLKVQLCPATILAVEVDGRLAEVDSVHGSTFRKDDVVRSQRFIYHQFVRQLDLVSSVEDQIGSWNSVQVIKVEIAHLEVFDVQFLQRVFRLSRGANRERFLFESSHVQIIRD
uniref:(northern house mosquito) hypothetical protein n=1 Tax=Culex pipiens TaxID=7175 RepID=A0A8D8J1K8_CULPI